MFFVEQQFLEIIACKIYHCYIIMIHIQFYFTFCTFSFFIRFALVFYIFKFVCFFTKKMLFKKDQIQKQGLHRSLGFIELTFSAIFSTLTKKSWHVFNMYPKLIEGWGHVNKNVLKIWFPWAFKGNLHCFQFTPIFIRTSKLSREVGYFFL